MRSIIYIILGVIFGITMYRSSDLSWFRIVEMFQFQSFHMYGFIGPALFIGVIATQIIKRKHAKDLDGNTIQIVPKDKSIKRYLFGGISFGLGWALIGASPGPVFVLLGSGLYSMIIVIFAALTGTWLYGILKHKLPH